MTRTQSRRGRIRPIGLAAVVVLSMVVFAPTAVAEASNGQLLNGKISNGQVTDEASTACTEGDLYFAGGSLGTYASGNTEVYERMVAEAGGPDEATVAIVPAASGEPYQSYLSWRADFNGTGVPNSSINIVKVATRDDSSTESVDESTWADNGDNDTVAAVAANADIVWFSGGAQHRIVEVLMKGSDNRTDTTVMAAIRENHECDGDVVGGSSAGAAMAGRDMVGAGDSYGAIRDGVSETDTYGDSSDYRVWVTQGLGLLPDGLMTGTHFQQRARTTRLVRALWYQDSSRDLSRQQLGFGIGENTTLVFEGGTTTAHVIGQNGVTVFDIRDATAETPDFDSDAINISNVRVHYLTKYDSLDYGGSSLSFSPDTANKTVDTVADPYYDGNKASDEWVENADTVPMMTEDVIDNTESSVTGTEMGDGTDYAAKGDKGVRITYTQTASSEGYWGDAYDDGTGRYFVSHLVLDIESFNESTGGGGGQPPWAGGN